MTRGAAWAAGLALSVIALVAGYLVGARLDTPATGSRADSFFSQTLEDLDGQPHSMNRWRGQLVVVNFWATWCAPCVEEMPALQSIHDEYAARGVVVVGLGIDSPTALRSFRDQHRLTLPLYAAGATGGELGRALGNTSGALPYTVLLDAEGRIVQARLGQIRAPELRRWLDSRASAGAS